MREELEKGLRETRDQIRAQTLSDMEKGLINADFFRKMIEFHYSSFYRRRQPEVMRNIGRLTVSDDAETNKLSLECAIQLAQDSVEKCDRFSGRVESEVDEKIERIALEEIDWLESALAKFESK